MVVNAAMAFGVEKRASSGRMRLRARQQFGMVPANDGGFDLENRQAIDTAVCAADTTLKTRRIRVLDGHRDLVHDRMKRLDPVGRFVQGHR